MAFQNLCPPALIYLIFSITQIVIDTVKGLYNTALIKIWVAFIFTILLNYLCQAGLGIISWFIVFIPFLLMTLVVAILLLMFGLDPKTGKIKILDNKRNHRHHKKHHHHPGDHHGRGKSKDDEDDSTENDVMNYYNSGSALGGGGGGVTSDNHIVDEAEPKKAKASRILKKSLLFYTEGEDENPETPQTKFKEDKEHLDTSKFLVHVNKIHNMLSTIGESELASTWQIKAKACIDATKKMSKEEAKKAIEKCAQDESNKLLYGVWENPANKQKYAINIIAELCEKDEDPGTCRDRVQKSWWN